jgi:hypothetical protein
MHRKWTRSWLIASLVGATVLIIVGASGVLTTRFWVEWGDRAIETAVLEGRAPEIWWPPSWRERYDEAAPIFRVRPNARFDAIPGIVAGLQDGTVARILPSLTRGIEHKDPGVRKCAAVALKELGRRAAPATPSLIQAIEDPDEAVAMLAIETLARIGPPADDAVPALALRLKDVSQSEGNRCIILSSLGKLGPRSLPVLLEVLRDEPRKSVRIRINIIRAIGDIRYDAEEAVPELLDVKKQDPTLSFQVDKAIVKIMGN